ncbi:MULTISPECIES: hypothetical protein [Streptomyces]|uniref:hypothetical protein n=1 Tax=Streptomyces TaxID=1883 RepID=UPI000A375722|nr:MULTISPECIES: hypothetical protein [Streptomyces]MDX3615768.1 hypothetical protein [Streptomyces europaeiscabiei]MDX3636827.1 hypothetical protein [Streptomyces europaeiscabiei]MDX3655052.1 hypothetical protein [Streptomyces europaeiscabiei]
MAVHEHPHRSYLHLPSFRRNRVAFAPGSAVSGHTGTHTARVHAFVSLRLLTGFVLLWAFLDRTFGLGHATQSGRGWIEGGSPTKGFLGAVAVAVGPMESTFGSWAGDTWADRLFMLGLLGLLGIGVALVAGVALRLAAVAGTVMTGLMRVAAWPPARHLSDGAPSMSTNPFVDHHLIHAVTLIALAAASVRNTLGLGKVWARLPLVRDSRWLR